MTPFSPPIDFRPLRHAYATCGATPDTPPTRPPRPRAEAIRSGAITNDAHTSRRTLTRCRLCTPPMPAVLSTDPARRSCRTRSWRAGWPPFQAPAMHRAPTRRARPQIASRPFLLHRTALTPPQRTGSDAYASAPAADEVSTSAVSYFAAGAHVALQGAYEAHTARRGLRESFRQVVLEKARDMLRMTSPEAQDQQRMSRAPVHKQWHG
mmetsp:Transcript_37283/g.84451  ORF Transcript_37283/g.84451 Transcript_37283/m.84451 type:complete len:209 (-) Transcript_37283:214-840(-)